MFREGRYRNNRKRSFLGAGAMVLVFAVILSMVIPAFFIPANAETEKKEKKIVRVGYYICQGYQEFDENGVYSGYGYDYLKEISQFANWEYQFVMGSFSKCMELLEAGKIDLVGGVDKAAFRSDNVLYSDYTNRNSALCLFTSQGNSDINFEDFNAFNGMDVGIIEKDYQECYLDDYCRENGFSINKVYFPDMEKLEEALKDGAVDAIYVAEEADVRKEKVIAKLDEKPLYYAVNRNRKDILEDLNGSLKNIYNSNPSYAMQIKSKYNIENKAAMPSFTNEELEYIKNKKVVTVAYDKGWHPIEYFDEETQQIKGVTKDVFDLLSKYTGLQFEFVKGENLNEALRFVKTGRCDMISFVSHDYETSDKRGIYTSSICMNIPLVGVISKERSFENLEVVAMPKDYYLDILKYYRIKKYDTVEECFEAVNSGEAEATIANAYAANYYLANPKFENLIRQDLIGYSEDLAMGVSQKEDIVLLNIVNKGLHCISETELSNIVLSNYVVYEQPFIKKLYYSSPKLFVSFVAACCGMILLALIHVMLMRKEERVQAERDSLTGLMNRRKLENEVNKVILNNGSRHEKDLKHSSEDERNCFVMLDLDGFKGVNDKFGHPAGDMLLKEVGKELELLAGENNIVSRLGGDEFVIVFRNVTGRNEAVNLVEKVRRMVEGLREKNEKWSNISASVGAAMFDITAEGFKELYAEVDEALYQAKKTGKNKVVFFDEINEEIAKKQN
ncbi:MAG: diguanylate cyclase [Anaerovoracaceae bacterium]